MKKLNFNFGTFRESEARRCIEQDNFVQLTQHPLAT